MLAQRFAAKPLKPPKYDMKTTPGEWNCHKASAHFLCSHFLVACCLLLVAAACFAKSSPYMQKKLLANKVFGPLIYEWQKHRCIPRKAKRVALLTMIFSAVCSAYLLQNFMLTVLVFVLIIGPFIFLWRLPVSK